MTAIWYVTNTIRLIMAVCISLVVVILPNFILKLFPLNTRKRLAKWLESSMYPKIGLPQSPKAETGLQSCDTSLSTTERKHIDHIKELQRLADDASNYYVVLNTLLQSIALPEMTWKLRRDPAWQQNYPLGCVGLFASIYLRQNLGYRSEQAMPEMFNRETYLRDCARVYDVLHNYYMTTQKEERENENEHRSNGPRTS